MKNFMIQKVLNEWKEESGLTHLMLYRVRGGVLTIYSDRPGVLIGRMGERIDRYKQKLLALPFGLIKEVRLEETDGIF